MSRRNIKPCPFCGSDPELKYVQGILGRTSDRVVIQCGPCGISFLAQAEDYDWKNRRTIDTAMGAQETVLAKWNRRPAEDELEIRNAHLAFPHIAAELTENQGMAGSRIFSSTVSMTESAVRNVPLNVLERDLRERLHQQFQVIIEAVAKFQADAKKESGEES